MGFFDIFNSSLHQKLEEQTTENQNLRKEIQSLNEKIQSNSQIILAANKEKGKLLNSLNEKNIIIQEQTKHIQYLEKGREEFLSKIDEINKANQFLTEKLRNNENERKEITKSANKQILQLIEEKDSIISEKNYFEKQLSDSLTQIDILKAKFLPYIGTQNHLEHIQTQISNLERKFYMQEFLLIIKTYYMEKVISEKRCSLHLRHKQMIHQFKKSIYDYEQELHKEEYKVLSPYISSAEFCEYSIPSRNQLALNRYNAMKKTTTEIGLAYERYIGYLYEIQNYEVRYHGALNKFKDRGIDLYAIRKKEVLVIQCKRWNKNTMVGDGTIRELQGSIAIAQKKFPTRHIKGILYTTTKVSAEAKKEAETLGIEIYEDFPIKEYPMVKCNISETGEKIYHLPFDQLYDKTFITPSKGDFYAETVEEAESFGFRHAHKWNPKK